MTRLLSVLCLALLLSVGSFAQTAPLSASVFAQKVKETPGSVVLDVRTPQEFGKGHLPGALNANWNDTLFAKRVEALDKATPLFVYCLGGSRSAAAAGKLRQLGYTQVYDLEGGIMKWRQDGLPEEGGAIRGMTTDQYNTLVQRSDKLVLVDFYAEWCGPCKLMKPYLDEIARTQADKVEIVRIDTDLNPGITRTLRIEALPTLILYKAGKVKWANVGYVPKKTVLKQIKSGS
ncbi:thioredoxin [Flaviaesturariibacter amylovorans]|uniref:Thioredoxin n=1 Tax=Flaviaesturariibacter amylovorans TaxID=1084520 RepID=A0ABP8G6Y3_9BACT